MTRALSAISARRKTASCTEMRAIWCGDATRREAAQSDRATKGRSRIGSRLPKMAPARDNSGLLATLLIVLQLVLWNFVMAPLLLLRFVSVALFRCARARALVRV